MFSIRRSEIEIATMKFMKLGSKQDIFTVDSGSTSVACDLPSDITFDVDGHKFHLHKFPLLAKCGGLNKLIAESGQSEEILIHGFPGGATCFEMCAKYCYGITITLSPHNVGEVRCGAEFLEMTETTEKSNLIYKLEVFLNSSILRGWKDAIICLRSSKTHMPWSEDLKIIGRCIESISSKACVNANEVDWSYSYSRLHTSASGRSSPVSWSRHRMSPAPKDWWVEDIIDLDIDLYTRVIHAIKEKGGSPDVVAESIRVYTLKCLAEILQEPEKTPNEEKGFLETTSKEKQILETIVSLLPLEKGTSSCSFLLRLLKAATFLDASPATKMELARRVGLQLEEASLHDLIIPSVSYSSDTVCDVDLMIHIVEHYMTQFHGNQAQMGSSVDFDSDAPLIAATATAMHGSLCKVAKVIDRYLAEIARDSKMPIPKFIQLASSVPDFARPVHDGLYRAIDMYLKEHPLLTKSERKKICRLMDCKKLSMEACMHAAQNERLPLRVMVQVLFFDQVRTSANGVLLSDLQGRPQQASEYAEEPRFSESRNGNNPNESSNGDENWETVHQDFTALKGDLASIKVRIAEAARERSMLMQQDTGHVKNKGVLSALKPEKLFSRLFSSRGFSSSESSRDSVSSELSMSMKQQLRQSSA